MTDVCRACACRRHYDRSTCRPCALTSDDIPGLRRRIADLGMRLHWRTREGTDNAGGAGLDENNGGRSNVRGYDNLQPHRRLVHDAVTATRLGADPRFLWDTHERLERALGLLDPPMRLDVPCLRCDASWNNTRQEHGLLADDNRAQPVWCTRCGGRWGKAEFRAARRAAAFGQRQEAG